MPKRKRKRMVDSQRMVMPVLMEASLVYTLIDLPIIVKQDQEIFHKLQMENLLMIETILMVTLRECLWPFGRRLASITKNK
jgi:hypothetical protein